MKGVTLRKVEVKNQPLENEEYIIGELPQNIEVEINVKEFDYYLIKYNDRYAYVKADGIKEI